MTDKKARNMKHWPEDKRPRERLVAHGPASPFNAQLLAIIIKNGQTRRTALDLAMTLLVKFNDFAGVERVGFTGDGCHFSFRDNGMIGHMP